MKNGNSKRKVPVKQPNKQIAKKNGYKQGGEAHQLYRKILQAPCLSECAINYVKAIHAPWSSVRACVPLEPCFPSMKVTTWVKGSMVTGTQGVGFVLVKPTAMVANDANSVFFSSNATTFVTAALSTSAAGTGATNSNSPFTASTFTADETYYRLVGCGIRVRYVGTELNRGGSVVSLCEPDHTSLDTFGRGSLMTYKSVHAEATRRGWHECCWFPIDAVEVAYRADPVNDSTPCMAVMVQAADSGTSVTYEYEVFCKFEAHGRTAQSMTYMRGDAAGGNAALQHFAAHAPTGRINSTHSSIKSSLDNVDKIVKDASGIYNSVKNAASSAKGWWDTAVSEVNNLLPAAEEYAAVVAR